MMKPTCLIAMGIAAVVVCGLGQAAQAAIVATEVGNNAPGTDGDNEYVVLFNNGVSSVDLTGYGIGDSTGYDAIGAVILGAGQYLVISSDANQAALETAWEQTIPRFALFTVVSALNSYNNTGTDEVNIQDTSPAQIYTFTYDATLGDDDPPTAIGLGATGGSGGTAITPFSTIIPEPASLVLLGFGGLMIGLRRHMA